MTTDRDALLREVLVIGEDLELPHVLHRITQAAARLTGARYAALGVLGPDRRITRFITHGITAEQQAAIGPPPHGAGILGVLIDTPQVVRLPDLTRDPRSVGFPPHHPPMHAFLGAPLLVRGQVFGNVYLTEKSGGFTEDDEAVLTALATAAGVVVAHAQLVAESERRRRWVEASAAMLAATLESSQAGDAVQQVVRQARAVSGAAHVAVVEVDADGTQRAIGVDPPDVEPSGAVGATEDGDVGAEATLVVPLPSSGGGAEGRLVLRWPDAAARHAADVDADVVQGFAAHAALALDRLSVQRDREALAVLTDRDRIARDLHDVVIQRLFATGLSLHSGARLVGRRGVESQLTERLDAAIDDLDATIRDIRATIFALHRGSDRVAVREALRQLLDSAGGRLGLATGLVIDPAVPAVLPSDLEADLEAALREATSNAARHGRATRVDVDLLAAGDVLVLRVRDDGGGIGPISREGGLRNLRERAERRDGDLEVRALESGGTELAWRVSLRSAD